VVSVAAASATSTSRSKLVLPTTCGASNAASAPAERVPSHAPAPEMFWAMEVPRSSVSSVMGRLRSDWVGAS
jgi:hypothetical protein